MKFSKTVVLMAWAVFAISATAETEQKTKDTQATTVNVNVHDTAVAGATATPTATNSATTTATTTAQAAPAASPAEKKFDELKKARQAEENKNDDKIVEKLEKTRLEDEKDLSKKIDATDLKDKKAEEEKAPVVKIEKVEVVPAETPVVAPLVVEEKKEEPKKEEKKEDKKWYAGVGFGNIIYNGNVLTKSDWGLVVGTKMDEHLIVEGSLNVASFTLNNYWGGIITNGVFGSMDQYDFAVSAKYLVLENERFKPYVGAGADYIYRRYKDRIPYTIPWGYDNYTAEQTTNAFNGSLLAGVDVNLTKYLSVGGEFRYSLPIYRQDNGLITASYVMQNAKPLEESSFTSWLLTVKFLF